MRKMIILVILLMNCINTERGRCKSNNEKNDETLETCALYYIILKPQGTIRDSRTNQVLFEGVTDPLILQKCIIAIEKERECKKKSEYIPTFD
jgi:hypothetical protein